MDPDLTIEERNDTNTHSTPLLKSRRRHSYDHTETTVDAEVEADIDAKDVEDTDMTIQQHHSILHMSTPVRQRSVPTNASKRLVASNSKRVTAFSNKENIISATTGIVAATGSCIDNDDETQIMSSPTRLMSTPSSIGAAKCLLQLAYR